MMRFLLRAVRTALRHCRSTNGTKLRVSRDRRALPLCAALFAVICSPAVVLGAPPQKSGKQPPKTSQPSPYGETVFSRGSGIQQENEPESTKKKPANGPKEAAHHAKKDLVTNAERTALTYDSYRFEVHLDPAQHSIAVHANMAAHNRSKQPLRRIALQISSSLEWYSIQVDGNQETFQVETVASDIDHTGELNEAVVPLPKPLAPGASLQLNVIYSGTVQQSGKRLTRLGAPADVAASSDWDRIEPGFSALRGFGNVIWFPVSTVPVLLGQGNQVFDSIGKWKRQEAVATVEMRVLVTYTGQPPTVALLNGDPVSPENSSEKQSPSSSSSSSSRAESSLPRDATAGTDSVPRVATFALPPEKLGFAPLSLFVIRAEEEHSAGVELYARPGNGAAAANYKSVVEQDLPLIQQWLGPSAKRPLILVDLPDEGDLPFEQDNLLLLPFKSGDSSNDISPLLMQALSHSYFRSARPWLSEGVSRFMALLWVEQRAGRANAIAQMDVRRAALALAETSDPGADPGQGLIDAWSEIYYRDKAADVLWMLRDIVGDKAMATALQSYRSVSDNDPDYFQNLIEKASGKKLAWFFDNWVYRDRGLPDLHIVSAYQRPIRTKNSARASYLVSVEVKNDGFCVADVPVTVEGGPSVQTRRLRVPAHSSATLRLLMPSEPTTVTVNDGSVPEVRTSRHEAEILKAP
jgi:hypothetical protein